jgi:hypothetical protein
MYYVYLYVECLYVATIIVPLSVYGFDCYTVNAFHLQIYGAMYAVLRTVCAHSRVCVCVCVCVTVTVTVTVYLF